MRLRAWAVARVVANVRVERVRVVAGGARERASRRVLIVEVWWRVDCAVEWWGGSAFSSFQVPTEAAIGDDVGPSIKGCNGASAAKKPL